MWTVFLFVFHWCHSLLIPGFLPLDVRSLCCGVDILLGTCSPRFMCQVFLLNMIPIPNMFASRKLNRLISANTSAISVGTNFAFILLVTLAGLLQVPKSSAIWQSVSLWHLHCLRCKCLLVNGSGYRRLALIQNTDNDTIASDCIHLLLQVFYSADRWQCMYAVLRHQRATDDIDESLPWYIRVVCLQ